MKIIKKILSSLSKEKKSLQSSNQSIFLIQKEDFEDFYSTIKFKNGEEIFSKVALTREDDCTVLLLSNPIKLTEIISSRRGMISGYKIEPWLKTTDNDLFPVNLEDVLILSENNDNRIIQMYETFVKQSNGEETPKGSATRKMGYLSNVTEAKKILEKLYNDI